MLTVTAFDHLVPDVRDSEAPHKAMLFSGRSLRVAVIEPDDKVSMRDVTTARDFGATVELSSGLSGASASRLTHRST